MKKKLRVKKNEDIEKIIKNRDTVGSKFFVIYKLKNDLNHFKMALSVSKKYGNAVKRNLIKRRLRSIVNNFQFQAYDFFIVVKVPTNELSYQEIEYELTKLLKRSGLTTGENS